MQEKIDQTYIANNLGVNVYMNIDLELSEIFDDILLVES